VPGVEIASVSVPEMDDEHEECATRLDALAQHRTPAALEAVLDVMEEHFAHEEELLNEHLYGDVDAQGGFNSDKNMRDSHYSDHARMLTSIRKLLSECKSGAVERIPLRRVNEVLRDFEQHANLYDASYADRMSAKLSAKRSKAYL